MNKWKLGEPPCYRIWHNIKQRCLNPNRAFFDKYGGRGITICERWMSFENFVADMGPRPPGCNIDRINNDGNYEPGNCRWATMKEQNRNKRTTRFITHRGKTLCLTDWERELGLSRGALRTRLLNGWDIERALTEPMQHHVKQTKKDLEAL